MWSASLRRGWILGLVSLVACSGSAPEPRPTTAPAATVFEVPPAAGDQEDAPHEGAKGGTRGAIIAGPSPAAAPRAAAPAPDVEPEDTAIYRVPVGASPVRGKATALVTMVVFSDFQCPFCARVEPTLKQLSTEYGDKLR